MTLGTTEERSQIRELAGIRDYIRIARLDHVTKHVFVVPGIVLAAMLRGVRVDNIYLSALLGLITVVTIASANYVINEFLDREFDRYHPTKSVRAAVQREMKGSIVIAEWLILVVIGLGSALLHSHLMFFLALVFASQGVLYNVQPLRTKDKAYLDVISESINNPLRLAIGWAIVDSTTLPPGSLILAYWFGGAFLMGAKRLSEFREIVASHGFELLARYRASFKGYTEISLIASCLNYALLSVAFLSIFLIKYRIEFIFLLPFVVALFVFYFSLSCEPGSTAQKPERLFLEKGLLLVVAAVVVVFLITSYVSLPWLEPFASQHYIGLN
jgi:4-hydroxybenzoate polyprenyltransferase